MGSGGISTDFQIGNALPRIFVWLPFLGALQRERPGLKCVTPAFM